MKYFAVLIAALLLFSCNKQKVSGTEISITYTSDSKADSIVVTDNLFTQWHAFPDKGKITANFDFEKPNLYVVAFFKGGKHYTGQLWLNNGKPEVALDFEKNTVVIDTVQNAPLYYEYFAFLDTLDTFNDDTEARNTYLLKKFESHKNDNFSNLIAANYYSYNRDNPAAVKSLFAKIERQSEDVKKGPESIYEFLKKELAVTTLSLSDYQFTGRDGTTEMVYLSAGKLYIVDFWFVKCPPCVCDHKIIAQNLEALKKNNLEVIGISIDASQDMWSSYLLKHNYTWQNFRQMGTATPAGALGLWEYPTYIVIDSNGRILSEKYHAVQDLFNYYIK